MRAQASGGLYLCKLLADVRGCVARSPRYGGRRHAVCNVSPPAGSGDWGDNTCVTQVSTHIYMCDNLGEDVQDELGNDQTPVKYTVRVATVGTAVSMLQNTQSVISTVRQVRSAGAGPSLHALPLTAVGPTKVSRCAPSHLSTGDPHVATREPRRAASGGLPQDGAGVEEVSPTRLDTHTRQPFVLCALCFKFRRTAVAHRAHKAIQGGDCCPRRVSWLRFPWLSPIRNPFELRPRVEPALVTIRIIFFLMNS